MPTLVCDDPKSSCRKTDHETVKCPKAKFHYSVKSRVWEVQVLRGNVRVDIVERVDETCNNYNVLEDVHARLDGRTLEAVGTGEKRGNDATINATSSVKNKKERTG